MINAVHEATKYESFPIPALNLNCASNFCGREPFIAWITVAQAERSLMEKTPTLRAHVVIDISIWKLPMGCVASTIKPHRLRFSGYVVEVATSHGVQAFIGQLLKSGILVQILFLFHDDFPFFCVVFSSACIYAPSGPVLQKILLFYSTRCRATNSAKKPFFSSSSS